MGPMAPRFLLSPASSSGRRAGIVLRPEAAFDLAVRLRTGGAPLGEVYAFLSGLYFRGKQAYARAQAPEERIHVITPTRGLMPLSAKITCDDLREFATVDIASGDPRYREPLSRDCARLAGEAGPVVLLGSIASGKYVDVLLEHLGERLMFPEEFVGRGDMSRGGLMLRAVQAGRTLPVIPVMGAVRRGKRPPKLLRSHGG